MRHALTLALQEYEGAMVLVSHDRHLLRTTADDLWLVADGACSHSTAIWTTTATGCGCAKPATPPPRRLARRASRKSATQAEARNRRYARKRPLAERLAKLERRMAELERERALLGKWLADPESYADANKFKAELAREGQAAAESTKRRKNGWRCRPNWRGSKQSGIRLHEENSGALALNP